MRRLRVGFAYSNNNAEQEVCQCQGANSGNLTLDLSFESQLWGDAPHGEDDVSDVFPKLDTKISRGFGNLLAIGTCGEGFVFPFLLDG